MADIRSDGCKSQRVRQQASETSCAAWTMGGTPAPPDQETNDGSASPARWGRWTASSLNLPISLWSYAHSICWCRAAHTLPCRHLAPCAPVAVACVVPPCSSPHRHHHGLNLRRPAWKEEVLALDGRKCQDRMAEPRRRLKLTVRGWNV